MLFDSFTSQAVEASLDSLWMKTQVISNNMANVDTPGFKASRVSFEQVLRNTTAKVQNHEGKEILPQDSGARMGQYQARVSRDTTSSMRLDGNNVSLEREQSELWKTYAQYSYLLDRISGHYGSINTAITNMKG